MSWSANRILLIGTVITVLEVMFPRVRVRLINGRTLSGETPFWHYHDGGTTFIFLVKDFHDLDWWNFWIMFIFTVGLTLFLYRYRKSMEE